MSATKVVLAPMCPCKSWLLELTELREVSGVKVEPSRWVLPIDVHHVNLRCMVRRQQALTIQDKDRKFGHVWSSAAPARRTGKSREAGAGTLMKAPG